MKMTIEFLHELGSCSDYMRIFRRQFPVADYPEGVEITEEICQQHADRFDWSWAGETLLNYDGRIKVAQVVDELRNRYRSITDERESELSAFKVRHNIAYFDDAQDEVRTELRELRASWEKRLADSGFDETRNLNNQMNARAFGRTFNQHPALRTSNLDAIQERAVQRIEQEHVDRYDAVKNELAYTQSEITRLQGLLPAQQEKLDAAEAAVVPALARRALAKAKMLAERAATAQQLADAAAAEAKTFEDAAAAQAAKTETSENDAPVTEATASAETETAPAS